MLDKEWCIYRIQNLVNGKIYIGQTVNPSTRWRRHRTQFTNDHLESSVVKYGEDVFFFKVLESSIFLQQDADKRECFWISHYKSNNPIFGYNKTTGGQSNYTTNYDSICRLKISHCGKHKTKESIEKMIETKKLRGNWKKKHTQDVKDRIRQSRLNKKLSEETKRKISDSKKGTPSYWKGKKKGPMDDLVKHKISESNKGVKKRQRSETWAWNNGLTRRKCVIGKDVCYLSINDARRMTGKSYSYIRNHYVIIEDL